MAWRKKRGKKYLVEWRYPPGDPTARTYSRGGFGTAAAADAFIKVVDDTVASGHNWEPPRAAQEEAPGDLLKAMVRYLDHVELTRAVGTVRNRTISLELFRRFIMASIPAPTVAAFSKSLLSRFLVWLRLPENAQRKSRTVDGNRKIVEHVQLFWAWCHDDDDLGAVTPRVRKLEDLRGMRSPRTPTRAPTWADMDALIVALARAVPGQRVQRDVTYLVLMAFVERCTGLRVSQVEALRVGDVDIGTGVLTFRGELGKSLQEKSGRLLPIAPVLLDVLRVVVAGRSPLDPLVPALKPVSQQKRGKRMGQAWAATGVPEAVWKQRINHAMRKGFFSELGRAGISKEVRDFLTGHSLGIAGVYTDPSALPLREAVAAVARLSPEAQQVVDTVLSTSFASRAVVRTPGGLNE